MSSEMKVSEVLACAAEVVEAVGLTRGRLCDDETGRVCMLGAVDVVVSQEVVPYLRAFDALGSHLQQAPHHWNDDPERTAAEVISTLRRVARKEAEKEARGQR